MLLLLISTAGCSPYGAPNGKLCDCDEADASKRACVEIEVDGDEAKVTMTEGGQGGHTVTGTYTDLGGGYGSIDLGGHEAKITLGNAWTAPTYINLGPGMGFSDGCVE